MGDVFAPFVADPATAAVLTDFDGTLAPIVEDPAAAAPLPGATEVLQRLTARFGFVGVVSGRPVTFLRDRLGDELWLSGLYGLETFADGSMSELPEAASWRSVVAETFERARRTFGDAVEAKGLSLTLHYRRAPEQEVAMRVWADDEARRSGLVVRSAKASFELHPPVTVDKGSVVEQVAVGMRSMCFLGDDVGDLAAFDALDRLAATPMHVVKVAVATVETPPALVARADVVVDGPAGALALLEQLAQTDAS